MWTVKGNGKNIKRQIIASFSSKRVGWLDILKEKTIQIYQQHGNRRMAVGLSEKDYGQISIPIVDNLPSEKLNEVHEGDILQIFPDGTINRLYDIASTQNALFLTERCNSHCIMCPHPQKNIEHAEEVFRVLHLLSKNKKAVKDICITGGEPTTSTYFIEVMKMLKEFPHVFPIVLTNGRNFQDFSYAQQVIANAPYNTVYAIPLYSAVPQIHDEIVGCQGAFKETIKGMHNLVRFRVPIEVRIVLTKQVITGLEALANFIGWNFPMVVHVAFMGMEIHGRAASNQNKIWIEPLEYMDTLYSAVKNLDYRGLYVSIYNLPLCLLPEKLRKYSTKSISEWKDGYIDECQNCSQVENCAGFFTTSDIIPKGIHQL